MNAILLGYSLRFFVPFHSKPLLYFEIFRCRLFLVRSTSLHFLSVCWNGHLYLDRPLEKWIYLNQATVTVWHYQENGFLLILEWDAQQTIRPNFGSVDAISFECWLISSGLINRRKDFMRMTPMTPKTNPKQRREKKNLHQTGNCEQCVCVQFLVEMHCRWFKIQPNCAQFARCA